MERKPTTEIQRKASSVGFLKIIKILLTWSFKPFKTNFTIRQHQGTDSCQAKKAKFGNESASWSQCRTRNEWNTCEVAVVVSFHKNCFLVVNWCLLLMPKNWYRITIEMWRWCCVEMIAAFHKSPSPFSRQIKLGYHLISRNWLWTPFFLLSYLFYFYPSILFSPSFNITFEVRKMMVQSDRYLQIWGNLIVQKHVIFRSVSTSRSNWYNPLAGPIHLSLCSQG